MQYSRRRWRLDWNSIEPTIAVVACASGHLQGQNLNHYRPSLYSSFCQGCKAATLSYYAETVPSRVVLEIRPGRSAVSVQAKVIPRSLPRGCLFLFL